MIDVINRIASSFPTKFLDIMNFANAQQVRTVPASQLAYFVLSSIDGTSDVNPTAILQKNGCLL